MLAIIMDVYTEVKTDAVSSVTIWAQLAQIYQSLVSRRDWKSNNHVVAEVEKLPPNIVVIDKDMLVEVIPGMTEEQAANLVDEADKRAAADLEKGLGMSDAMKM